VDVVGVPRIFARLFVLERLMGMEVLMEVAEAETVSRSLSAADVTIGIEVNGESNSDEEKFDLVSTSALGEGIVKVGR